MESKVLYSMRTMAWERAKGELQSMLWTLYPEYLSDGRSDTGNYEPLKETIEQFIKEVEDHSLHE